MSRDEGLEACAESMLLRLQAREATTRGQLTASHGLLQTAISLFDRAIRYSSDDSPLAPYQEELAGALCFSAQVIEIEGVMQLKKPRAA